MNKKKSLAEVYQQRPQGTRQIRAKSISANLNSANGALLVDKVAEIARHTAQLSIEMMEPGLVVNFGKACPEGGITSKIARKKAPIINPAFTNFLLLPPLEEDSN
jgi:hypothetical protein